MPSDPSRDHSSSSTREGWLRDFSVLLRLRGIDGIRIGDELAKVETFCDDSGQEPKDAYGEPASYIATLHFAPSRSARRTAAVILPVLALVIGGNLAVGAALHWGGGVAITAALVSAMLVVIASLALLIRRS